MEIQLPLQKLTQLVSELLHHTSDPQLKLFQEQHLEPFDDTGDCVGDSVPVGTETGNFVGLAVGADVFLRDGREVGVAVTGGEGFDSSTLDAQNSGMPKG